MNRVNQLPEVINIDDETHIEHHEIIHEALRGYDVEIASKADAEHTHQWTEIESTPETYPPSSHKHSASDINSGTLGIARIPVGTASGTVASGNDPRFTDSRTPKAHTHGISDVTDLGQRLDVKADLVDGKVPTSQIPAIALTKPSSVTSRAAMTALDAQEGDIAIISTGADKGSYILGDGPSTSFDSWLLLAVESNAPVQSVNGQVGTVVLGPLDIGAAKENHSHTISDISNLQDALDNAGSNDAAELTGALTDQVSADNATVTYTEPGTGLSTSESLSTVGFNAAAAFFALGDLYGQLDGKSDVGHTHPVSDLDTIGTASSSTFLRGDGAWMSLPTITVTESYATAGTASITYLWSPLRVRQAANAAIAAREWVGTQAQYDAIGTKNPNITYYIVD